jgi:hypothetical protein
MILSKFASLIIFELKEGLFFVGQREAKEVTCRCGIPPSQWCQETFFYVDSAFTPRMSVSSFATHFSLAKAVLLLPGLWY